MRKLIFRTLYKRDFKREYKGRYRVLLKKDGEDLLILERLGSHSEILGL